MSRGTQNLALYRAKDLEWQIELQYRAQVRCRDLGFRSQKREKASEIALKYSREYRYSSWALAKKLERQVKLRHSTDVCRRLSGLEPKIWSGTFFGIQAQSLRKQVRLGRDPHNIEAKRSEEGHELSRRTHTSSESFGIEKSQRIEVADWTALPYPGSPYIFER